MLGDQKRITTINNLKTIQILEINMQIYLTSKRLKANLERQVLRSDLKVEIHLMLRRLTGKELHNVGAATLKDLSPNDFFIFPDRCFNKTPSWMNVC